MNERAHRGKEVGKKDDMVQPSIQQKCPNQRCKNFVPTRQ